MILFENDFYEQGACLHLNTQNKSFIRQAKLYKDLGCQNNKFFLSLYDRDIADYDPHNLTDPSIELRLRIAMEAKRNIWYVLRELIRVPSAGGTGYVSYIANRYNIALTWLVFNDIDNFSTILRQVGKTTALLVLDSALIYLMETNYRIGWLSKDTSAVQECVDRVKEIRDGLPSYLVNNTSKDTDNKEGIVYKSMKTSFSTFVAQKSPIQAKKASRGLSMPKQTYDEFGYIDNNGIIFSSAAAATTKAREQVHAVGSIAPICIATTAADPTSPAGKFAYKIMKECMRFQEKFFDCKNKEELHEILANGAVGKRKMFYINYSYKQLGYSDQWLEETIARVGCDEDMAAWDYYSIWKIRGTRGAIDPATMNIIRSSQIDPLYTDITESMVFNFFVHKDKLDDPNFCHKPFIIGGDSSENIEKDFCTLFLIDPLDMSAVMSFRCNKSNLNALARNIFKILLRFPRSIWVPERNHVGAMIVDTVIELLEQVNLNPLLRIYNQIVEEVVDVRQFNAGDIARKGFTGITKGKFGFRTTGGAKGRTALYSTTFKKALDLNKTKIRDATLIEQLGELEIKNGRVDHPNGKHDDMVIAYLLACYFVFFAKNLDIYGIKPHELIDLNHVLASSKDNQAGDEILTKVDYDNIIDLYKEIKFKYNTALSPEVKAHLKMKLDDYETYMKTFDIKEEVVTKQVLIEDHAKRNAMSAERRNALMGYFFKAA